MVVQAPISHSLFDAYTNKSEIDQFFQSFGVYYINLNHNKTKYPNKLFFDHHHLNQMGVKRMNTELIEILDEKGLLPIPRI